MQGRCSSLSLVMGRNSRLAHGKIWAPGTRFGAASLTPQHPPAGGRDEIRGVKNSQKARKKQPNERTLPGCSAKFKTQEEKSANWPLLKCIFGDVAPRCEFRGGKISPWLKRGVLAKPRSGFNEGISGSEADSEILEHCSAWQRCPAPLIAFRAEL